MNYILGDVVKYGRQLFEIINIYENRYFELKALNSNSYITLHHSQLVRGTAGLEFVNICKYIGEDTLVTIRDLEGVKHSTHLYNGTLLKLNMCLKLDEIYIELETLTGEKFYPFTDTSVLETLELCSLTTTFTEKKQRTLDGTVTFRTMQEIIDFANDETLFENPKAEYTLDALGNIHKQYTSKGDIVIIGVEAYEIVDYVDGYLTLINYITDDYIQVPYTMQKSFISKAIVLRSKLDVPNTTVTYNDGYVNEISRIIDIKQGDYFTLQLFDDGVCIATEKEERIAPLSRYTLDNMFELLTTSFNIYLLGEDRCISLTGWDDIEVFIDVVTSLYKNSANQTARSVLKLTHTLVTH